MKTFRLFFQMLIIALLGFGSSLSQEYCEPFFSAENSGSDKFTGITNVKLNSTPPIDNPSEYNDWYVYFDEVEAGGLVAGEEYELTVRVKWNTDILIFSYQPQIYAWVDWNQNFVFDQGEEIAEIANVDSIPFGEERETVIKFTVPQDAKLGITRLRISEDMAVSDGHIKNVPCGYSESHEMGQHGNVEDYNVVVLPPLSSPYNHENSKLNISINPNPITGENVSLILNLGDEANEIELFIIDLNGNIVQRINTDGVSNGENMLRFSTANLSSGSYFLISEYMGVKNMTTIVIAK